MLDNVTATCPACGGDGCRHCQGAGKMVIPSRVETQLRSIQRTLYQLRQIRDGMLDVYANWAFMVRVKDTRRITAVLQAMEMEDPRAVDLFMTADIISSDDEMRSVMKMVKQGEEMLEAARSQWRDAKRAGKPKRVEAPPPERPRETKKTKVGGKLCSFPKCKKDAREWDERGRGWCRKHAYERGLMERPKIEEEPE